MKMLLFLALGLFASCDTEEYMPTCLHEVQQNAKRDRAIIKVVSDLPEVIICRTAGDADLCITVQEHYYNCISLSIEGQTKVTIYAEGICKYTLK